MFAENQWLKHPAEAFPLLSQNQPQTLLACLQLQPLCLAKIEGKNCLSSLVTVSAPRSLKLNKSKMSTGGVPENLIKIGTTSLTEQ